MKKITLIDTNIFKYYLEGKFEDSPYKEIWTEEIICNGKPYISSATLCEYLVSRLNNPDEVKKTICDVISNYMVICDSYFGFVGLDKNNSQVELLYRDYDIYDIPKMDNANIMNHLKVIASLKAASEINYLYSFLECIRRIYIWVLNKEKICCGHEDELKQQLHDMYSENNKKFALDLAEKYYNSYNKKDIENSFSEYFYEATIMCFEEINSILEIECTTPINQNKNVLLEFLKQSLSIYDEEYNLKLIKESIKENIKLNKMIMGKSYFNDIDEESFISDKIESMFLSKERMKFKKNDCIDLAFMGCMNELKNHLIDATFITNDKRLSEQMKKYNNHRVKLLSDLLECKCLKR